MKKYLIAVLDTRLFFSRLYRKLRERIKSWYLSIILDADFCQRDEVGMYLRKFLIVK